MTRGQRTFSRDSMKVVTTKKVGPEDDTKFEVTVSFNSIYSARETQYLKDFLKDCTITEDDQLDQAIENYFTFWNNGTKEKYKTLVKEKDPKR